MPKEASVELDLSPDANDKDMEELLHILQTKGFEATLKELDRIKNPHIEDDFHRLLVQYKREGHKIPGLKKDSPYAKVLDFVLLEVAVPETNPSEPGGTLAVSVPRYWPEWICWALSEEYHNEPGGHVRIFRTGQLKKDVSENGLSFFHRHWAHGLHSPYWWLRCAVGVKNTKSKLVAAYHRFLVWDLVKQPWLTRTLEALAAPLMGKSVVLYFTKENRAA